MSWIKDLLRVNKKNKNVSYMAGVNWPKEKILEHALRADIESVTVIGWTAEGKMYLNSTYAKRGDLHWDLSTAARNVLEK